MHLNPSSSLEAAQRGVDALPGASGLMRELLLADLRPDDAVLSPGLAEQHFGDAAWEVQEDEVGGRLGEPAKGGRDGTRQGRRRACRCPGSFRAGRGAEADHDLDPAGEDHDQGVAWISPGEHDLAAAEADFRKATAADPKQFESHAALGRLLAQQSRWQAARQELELAAALTPASGNPQQAVANVERTLAHVDAQLHDPAAASDALMAALKLTPDQVELLRADNVVSDTAKAAGLTLEGLGITPDSLEAVAPQYLWRFRATGQFQKNSV